MLIGMSSAVCELRPWFMFRNFRVSTLGGTTWSDDFP